MTIKKIGKSTFKLCGLGPACPIIKLNKKTVVIEDDFGGKVKMKREEFEMLKQIK